MSEIFNPLNEARERAEIGRQVLDNAMEHNVQPDISVNERAQGYTDLAEYLESRPYEDDKGKLHDPVTGKFISEKDAQQLYYSGETHNGDLATLTEEDAYKVMSLAQLAQLSADAEVRNDRTTMLNVDDAIQDKVMNMPLSDGLEDRDGSKRESSERENVLNRVLKLRESYVTKLSASDSENTGSGSSSDTPEATPQNTDNPTEENSGNPTDDELQRRLEVDFELPAPNPFASAPNTEDRVVRSFLDEDGNPVGDIEKLDVIMATKVAEGDESDWNNLVQTMRDIIKNHAKNVRDENGNPVDVAAKIKGFERYARNRYKELKANQNRTGGTPLPPPEGTPVVTPHYEASPERPEKKRWKKIGKVIGGIALAGLALFGGKKAFDAANDDKALFEGKALPTAVEEMNEGGEENIPARPKPPVGNNQEDKPSKPEIPVGDDENESEDEEQRGGGAPEDIDLNDWTWNVAHQLAPGQEAELINKGIDAYNAKYGTDFSLQPKNGTTMIIDSQGNIVSPDEMEKINQLMVEAA